MLTAQQEKAKLERARKYRAFVLNSTSAMIDKPQYKKELIDIMNKHIEFKHKDSMPRINYQIKNGDLIKRVSVFLSMKHKDFNKDLSVLLSRYLKQRSFSNADGGQPIDTDSINTAINEVSTQSQTESGGKGTLDAMTLSMINRNIKKGIVINKRLVILIILGILAVIAIWYLVKYRKMDLLKLQTPPVPQIPTV